MEPYNRLTVTAMFLPVLLLAVLAEALIYQRRRAHYPLSATGISIIIGIGHFLTTTIANAVITSGLAVLVWRYRLAQIDLGDEWNIALLFLAVEFAYYWYHRSAHRVRLMWGSHSVHHSPEELTFAASYRLNWTPLLSCAWLFFLPLVWIGFAPGAVFGMVSANLLYQFWLHTTLIPRLGPLEWVFNTPSAHRVHHARNPEYLDRNYGGVLILFDRLFRTYARERDGLPIRYGLVHPSGSGRPAVIVFHEFYMIARDVWRARRWRDRIGHLLAPPGWRPAADGELTPPGR
jgi:sterol desaturase/sphingolipid hydroxylase (fatty acid hydroxylase superfamily)